MEINPIRPHTDSKTIISIDTSEKLQWLIYGVSGALGAGWFFLGYFNPSFQAKVQAALIPALGASITAMRFAGKHYAKAAKDGRIDVGDLTTPLSQPGPNEGDRQGVMLATKDDLAELEQAQAKAEKFDEQQAAIKKFREKKSILRDSSPLGNVVQGLTEGGEVGDRISSPRPIPTPKPRPVVETVEEVFII